MSVPLARLNRGLAHVTLLPPGREGCLPIFPWGSASAFTRFRAGEDQPPPRTWLIESGIMWLKRLACFLLASNIWAQARSEGVQFGPNGKLRYKTDSRGNVIMDFSHAGYQGGGVRIP